MAKPTANLEISVSTDELTNIRSGKQKELYRTATDEWFEKLYVTDPVLGIADLDKPLPYRYIILNDGRQKLTIKYEDLEVEEFMNQPPDSDERFGFVIVLGAIIE